MCAVLSLLDTISGLRSGFRLVTHIVTKPEGFPSYQLVTRNGWTPVLFDVFDREIRALEVTSVIPVMRVRQVATQEWLLVQIDELTKTEGSTEDTDVRRHSHHEYVLDASLLEQIVDFLTVIADRVLARNLNRLDLALPRRFTLSATRLRGVARARSRFRDSARQG